jgi:hypothetical protein
MALRHGVDIIISPSVSDIVIVLHHKFTSLRIFTQRNFFIS